ncbi:DUF6243 family protein [Streptomyces sp. NPDC015346]|uniref:DUF6243 family protein n=1 Tax=Streptomyces sp. NPDC015346 TaxID=3364954 RepID=UPI0036FEBE65
MAKGRNNLLGVGGQRKKLSRADQQGAVQSSNADRKAGLDQKQELLRKMRERAAGTESAEGAETDRTADAAEVPAGGQE